MALFCDSGTCQGADPPRVPTRSRGLTRQEAGRVQWAPAAADAEPLGPHSLWGRLTARRCGPLLPSGPIPADALGGSGRRVCFPSVCFSCCVVADFVQIALPHRAVGSSWALVFARALFLAPGSPSHRHPILSSSSSLCVLPLVLPSPPLPSQHLTVFCVSSTCSAECSQGVTTGLLDGHAVTTRGETERHGTTGHAGVGTRWLPLWSVKAVPEPRTGSRGAGRRGREWSGEGPEQQSESEQRSGPEGTVRGQNLGRAGTRREG